MRFSGTPRAGTIQGRHGDSIAYDVARILGSPFRYDVVGYENIQNSGPAIYLANHLGATGPLEVILSIPVRFYPWIVTEMLDFKRAPKYLFDDFVHPSLHLCGLFGMLVSTLITKISVRLLRAIHAVSIDRFGGLTIEGFRQSLRLLNEGKNLLIFPEDALLPLNPDTLMRQFMPGFASLCHIYLVERGILLPVYPLAVHAQSEMVAIGKPEYFSPLKDHKKAVYDFTRLMEDRVRTLYLELKTTYNDNLI